MKIDSRFLAGQPVTRHVEYQDGAVFELLLPDAQDVARHIKERSGAGNAISASDIEFFSQYVTGWRGIELECEEGFEPLPFDRDFLKRWMARESELAGFVVASLLDTWLFIRPQDERLAPPPSEEKPEEAAQ